MTSSTVRTEPCNQWKNSVGVDDTGFRTNAHHYICNKKWKPTIRQANNKTQSTHTHTHTSLVSYQQSMKTPMTMPNVLVTLSSVWSMEAVHNQRMQMIAVHMKLPSGRWWLLAKRRRSIEPSTTHWIMYHSRRRCARVARGRHGRNIKTLLKWVSSSNRGTQKWNTTFNQKSHSPYGWPVGRCFAARWQVAWTGLWTWSMVIHTVWVAVTFGVDELDFMIQLYALLRFSLFLGAVFGVTSFNRTAAQGLVGSAFW